MKWEERTAAVFKQSDLDDHDDGQRHGSESNCVIHMRFVNIPGGAAGEDNITISFNAVSAHTFQIEKELISELESQRLYDFL